MDSILFMAVAAIAVTHFVFGVSFMDILAWLKKEGATLRGDMVTVKADLVALEAKVKGWFEGHASGVATANAAGNIAGGQATAQSTKTGTGA